MVFFGSLAGQYVVQVLVHSMLMALVVEALLKIWKATRPGTRIQFRILYLLVPLLGWPVYQLLWPERGSSAFRESLALIDTQDWLSLHLGGVPGWGWVAGVMGLGTVLFVSRALVPTGQHHLLSEAGRVVAPARESKHDIGKLGKLLGPDVRVVDESRATISLGGVRRLRLTVSAPLLELLDEEELEAVLAHESAHARHRDNPRGWSLLLLGLLMFYNPVALVALQRISQDVEMACDDRAVMGTARPLALASALVKTARFNAGPPAGGARFAPRGWISRLNGVVGRDLVVRRAHRLIGYQAPRDLPLKWLKLALTATLSGTVLFFVV